MMQVVLIMVAASVISCKSLRKDDGEYFQWTSSNEPELVIDPNAPALPPEDFGTMAVTKDSLIAQRPVSTGMIQKNDDVIVPIVNPPETAVINEPSTPAPESVAKIQADHEVLKSQAALAKRPRGVFKTVGSGPQVRFIKADQLYIRVKPDRYSKALGLLYGGDEVHVKIQGDWAMLDEGRWIRSRWLVKKRPKQFKGEPQQENAPSEPESSPEVNDQSDKTAYMGR